MNKAPYLLVMCFSLLSCNQKKASTKYVNEANDYFAKEDYQNSMNYANKAIDKYKNNEEAFLIRSKSKLILGDTLGALEDVSHSINISDKFLPAYILRSQIKSASGKNTEAMDDLNRAILIDSMYTEAYYQRYFLNNQINDFNGSIRDLNKVIKLDSIKYFRALLYRGLIFNRFGDNKSAIVDFNSVISINPDYDSVYLHKGLAEIGLGNYDQAIADIDNYLLIGKTDYSYAYALRSFANIGRDRYAEAIKDANLALDIDSNNTFALQMKGYAKILLGDLNGGILDLSHIILNNPNEQDAYKLRAMGLTQQNKLKEAIQDYTSYINLNPDNSEAYFKRGLLYKKLNQMPNACSDFSKAADMGYEDAFLQIRMNCK